MGAIGGALAGMLAAAGEAPCLFARGRRLEQLRREGLRVLFAGGRAIEMRLPARGRADLDEGALHVGRSAVVRAIVEAV